MDYEVIVRVPMSRVPSSLREAEDWREASAAETSSIAPEPTRRRTQRARGPVANTRKGAHGMSSIRITHFSDLLCVWAYVSQVRCEELLSHFAGRVEMDCRYIHVFGSVQAKMAAVWGDRGGVAAYAAHVQSVASDFEH